MNEMQKLFDEVDYNTIAKGLHDRRNIIYGAGDRGRMLLERLKSKNVNIFAFYDDDVTRQGSTFCGKKIITERELGVQNIEQTNLLISSMYIPIIAKQAKERGFVHIYADINGLMEQDDNEFRFSEYSDNQEYISKLHVCRDLFREERSREYFNIVERSVLSGHASREICDIYLDEPQYFLNVFSDILNECAFVDAGAYTGDTIREMTGQGIKPSKCYCFEADIDNYVRLVEYIQSAGMDNIIAEHMALWDKEMELGIVNKNYNASVGDNCFERKVQSTTINRYFEKANIGFVKMDIEGAERYALAGGMRVIKRDRPILAISIYHSLLDMVDIPRMLVENLENYDFIIRHYSYTYSETIMYGVPREKGLSIYED